MKTQMITFFCSMGIPISALATQSRCTGICGNCQLTCFPGILALILLAGKYTYGKYFKRVKEI